MTNLETRAVTRQTNQLDPIKRRLPLVVRLEVGGKILRLKVKGTRTWYTVTFDAIFRLACRIRAVELVEERKRRRQQRRASSRN